MANSQIAEGFTISIFLLTHAQSVWEKLGESSFQNKSVVPQG